MPDSNGSGAMGITGHWLNKQTGKTINVRDSIIDGNNMLIITDNGQIPMDIFSRDYIQISDEVYNESGQVIGNSPAPIEDYGQNDDWAQIQEIMNGKSNNSVETNKPNITSNEQIIKKVFDKLTSYPKIDVNIKWDDFPEAQIHTLVDFLEISVDDISKYIIKNYINIEALNLEITDILKVKLNKNIE
jgi:hypothetical protein